MRVEAEIRSKESHLIVLVRNLPQLEAALKCGATTIYCEFEDPKKYREAVRLFPTLPTAAGQPEEQGIFVAPPRIFKMGEEWTLKQVRSCNADGYLVRNYDHLKFFAHGPAHWRLFAERRQPACRGLFQKPVRPGARDGLATI